MTKSDAIISWITGLTTLAMALLSFILSFNALADLADQYSVSIPPFIPLIIEGGVIVFSLNALWRSLHAIPARWQWSLIIGSSLLAGTFNVIHVQADVQPVLIPLVGWSINPARVMAALPSLFLLLSFETFLSQLKHGVKFNKATITLQRLEETLNARRDEVNAALNDLDAQFAQRQTEIDAALVQRQSEAEAVVTKLNNSRQAAQGKLDRLMSEIAQKQQELSDLERLQAERVQVDNGIAERRQKLLNILNTEGDIGPTAFAERLNVARNTIYSDFKALTEQGVVYKNGAGWKAGVMP